MTPSACGSASGERLPWKSGSTCSRAANSAPCGGPQFLDTQHDPCRGFPRPARRRRHGCARHDRAARPWPTGHPRPASAREARLEIGPPHAEARLHVLRKGDDAAGGAGNQGELPFEPVRLTGKIAENTDGTGIGVDQPGRDLAFFVQARVRPPPQPSGVAADCPTGRVSSGRPPRAAGPQGRSGQEVLLPAALPCGKDSSISPSMCSANAPRCRSPARTGSQRDRRNSRPSPIAAAGSASAT